MEAINPTVSVIDSLRRKVCKFRGVRWSSTEEQAMSVSRMPSAGVQGHLLEASKASFWCPAAFVAQRPHTTYHGTAWRENIIGSRDCIHTFLKCVWASEFQNGCVDDVGCSWWNLWSPARCDHPWFVCFQRCSPAIAPPKLDQ